MAPLDNGNPWHWVNMSVTNLMEQSQKLGQIKNTNTNNTSIINSSLCGCILHMACLWRLCVIREEEKEIGNEFTVTESPCIFSSMSFISIKIFTLNSFSLTLSEIITEGQNCCTKFSQIFFILTQSVNKFVSLTFNIPSLDNKRLTLRK